MESSSRLALFRCNKGKSRGPTTASLPARCSCIADSSIGRVILSFERLFQAPGRSAILGKGPTAGQFSVRSLAPRVADATRGHRPDANFEPELLEPRDTRSVRSMTVLSTAPLLYFARLFSHATGGRPPRIRMCAQSRGLFQRYWFQYLLTHCKRLKIVNQGLSSPR